MNITNCILTGDALAVLHTLPDNHVQTVITSPPYYGLRDYQVDGQIGLESNPDEFIAKLVEVFREAKRVLHPSGTAWINIGDSYAGSWGNYAPGGIKGKQRPRTEEGKRWEREAYGDTKFLPPTAKCSSYGLKPKDLIGIPWLLAFALRADGWYLRSDIIWHKPNCMPESVNDRPTSAHEHIFLLAKSERYYYDAQVIAEPSNYPDDNRKARASAEHKRMPTNLIAGIRPGSAVYPTRNKRNVWTVTSQPLGEAHFATFPPKLIEPCILAGSRPGDIVLDPFCGAGTTLMVASQLGRSWLGIELNPNYVALAERRIATVQQDLWSVTGESEVAV